jgi:hypothetical protein
MYDVPGLALGVGDDDGNEGEEGCSSGYGQHHLLYRVGDSISMDVDGRFGDALMSGACQWNWTNSASLTKRGHASHFQNLGVGNPR